MVNAVKRSLKRKLNNIDHVIILGNRKEHIVMSKVKLFLSLYKTIVKNDSNGLHFYN